MTRGNLPSGTGWSAVVMAAAMWAGAIAGALLPIGAAISLAGVALSVAVAVQSRTALLAVVIAIGAVSGSLAAEREGAVLADSIPEGPGALHGTATTDSLRFGERYQVVLRPSAWRPDGGETVLWAGPPIRVVTDVANIVAGDRLEGHGLLRSKPGFVRGSAVAGRFTAQSIESLSPTDQPIVAAGNLVRSRVQSRVGVLGVSPEAALLSGFLIGDIAELPSADEEALRRSGLTHFVAVSGSNVALVLGAWWLVAGPLGAGTRVRATTGLLVLMVFVVATRWESSVIRAATMAALVLGGRAIGVPLNAWTSLGAAVTILLAVSGDLALDAGFQLSVFATGGVLAGMGWWRNRSPRFFWTALAATAGAQLAVVPLLLMHFGSVPLLSPVANLVVAPMVTVATSLAGFGVLVNWDAPLHAAAWVAQWILRIARITGEWPQLDPVAMVGVAALSGIAVRTRTLPLLAIGVAAATAISLVPPGPPLVPTATFLDVGQGDAVLLRDPSGATVLVDGGSDPNVMRRALRRHGVGRIELMVASHGDADHIGGLIGIEESVDVAEFWMPESQEVSELLEGLADGLRESGTHIREVGAGVAAGLGDIAINVVGPQRRYAAENDGSVVLLVRANGIELLLPGDIGAVAQRELPPLQPDVLLVPHHGAGTTDLRWLARTVGDSAVISVGENTYGHPTPEVVATLEQSGADIRVTAITGDVVIPLE